MMLASWLDYVPKLPEMESLERADELIVVEVGIGGRWPSFLAPYHGLLDTPGLLPMSKISWNFAL